MSDADLQSAAGTVAAATRAFEEAQRTQDAERAIAHLAPDFYMYVDGVRADYDSIAAGIRRTFGTFQHVEPGFADVNVKVLCQDAALVSFTFRDSITTGSGELLRFRGTTTLVWERLDAAWRISYADADHYPLPAR